MKSISHCDLYYTPFFFKCSHDFVCQGLKLEEIGKLVVIAKHNFEATRSIMPFGDWIGGLTVHFKK